MLTEFQNSFTDRFSGKFATNSYLNIPPRLKYVAMLPCEIQSNTRVGDDDVLAVDVVGRRRDVVADSQSPITAARGRFVRTIPLHQRTGGILGLLRRNGGLRGSRNHNPFPRQRRWRWVRLRRDVDVVRLGVAACRRWTNDPVWDRHGPGRRRGGDLWLRLRLSGIPLRPSTESLVHQWRTLRRSALLDGGRATTRVP